MIRKMTDCNEIILTDPRKSTYIQYLGYYISLSLFLSLFSLSFFGGASANRMEINWGLFLAKYPTETERKCMPKSNNVGNGQTDIYRSKFAMKIKLQELNCTR